MVHKALWHLIHCELISCLVRSGPTFQPYGKNFFSVGPMGQETPHGITNLYLKN
jgi:hypothetical protein